MAKAKAYIPIPESQIPAHVRFDVPGENQGQIVIVSYGGFSRAEHGEGDPYMCIHDQSTRTVDYYRLAEIEEAALDLILSRRDYAARGIPTLTSIEVVNLANPLTHRTI